MQEIHVQDPITLCSTYRYRRTANPAAATARQYSYLEDIGEGGLNMPLRRRGCEARKCYLLRAVLYGQGLMQDLVEAF